MLPINSPHLRSQKEDDVPCEFLKDEDSEGDKYGGTRKSNQL